MRLTEVTVSALLTGCAGAGVAATGASLPNEPWLVGHWTPRDVDCESDGGVVFTSDGKWIAYEAAGTWKLNRRTLVALTTDRWDSGWEAQEKLARPERHTEIIEVVGPDSYRAHRTGGEVVEMKRCPTQTR